MGAKKGGLGRGFDALFEDNAASSLSSENSVTKLPIGDLEINRNQPRKTFDEESLSSLSDSIKENGVIQPIIVRPLSNGSYQIVAGERRFRAAAMAGLKEVPVIIRDLDSESVAVIALIENLQREDLSPLDQAAGIEKLIEDYGFTQERAAQKIGISRSALTNNMRLLKLPENTKKMLSEGEITQGHARALLGLDDLSLTDETALKVKKENLSVRDTEKLVKKLNEAKKEKPKPTKKRNPFYDEVELSVFNATGRKVTVKGKGSKKGGTIVIEFYDDDDLKKIVSDLEN